MLTFSISFAEVFE